MTTRTQVDGSTSHISSAEIRSNVDTSQWFEEIKSIPPQAQEILEKYSGIPSSEILQHVTSLRQRAFETYPYPCIGQLRFLELTSSSHPAYPAILERLKAGQTYLDVGCCVGQDVRKLLFDGVPSGGANMYGVDLEPGFFALGRELFRDADKLQATFIAADMTKDVFAADGASAAGNSDANANAEVVDIRQLEAKIDVFSTQSVFHLFTLEDQRALARNLVRMSKPGALVSGRQVGSLGGKVSEGLVAGSHTFAHNCETWRKFWHDIGEETGTKWEVEVTETSVTDRANRRKWHRPDMTFLVYTINRVS